MNSNTWTRITTLALFATLAFPLCLATQEPLASSTNPVPFINHPLAPDAIAPGGNGFTITVNGTGFVSGSLVKWNGSALTTTFVNGSQLKASVPASDIATARTASVTVLNPSPGGGTSNPVFFEITTPTSAILLNISKYGTGSGSQSVAVGDFNGDGMLDLAVANLYSNTVSVLLGKGDGTFKPKVDYPTGLNPASVAVGDFNGDGRVDLVVATAGGPTVSILLGKGDGTFQPYVEYGTGSGPLFVATGDFNGDGKLDLVSATNNSNLSGTVSVLLGNGDGTFQAHVDYGAGTGPYSVAVGDFNGDDKLDLAVANYVDGTVSVLLGNGDGTFQAQVDYTTGVQPISVTAGDFNGDGKLDLAVASFAGDTVGVFLGNGNGTFQARVDYAAGSVPYSVVVADFNGDDKLDLAVANDLSKTVSVLLGNGDGTFRARANYGAGSNPQSLAVGDFNRDGRIDLAVANYSFSGNATVSVLLQSTTVTLQPASSGFGALLVGSRSVTQNVTLTNTGVLMLTISSIATKGTNATDFAETNNCGSSLAPGKSCTIGVDFAPTHVGPRTAALKITGNAAGSPPSVPLSGIGVESGPNATLSPARLTFATQLVGTSSPAQSVMLSNYGTTALSITGIVASGDFSESNACGSSVAAGASCTISVTFKPTQSGSRTGTLSITDNAPGSPQTVSLTGTGTVVELIPASLSFGTVPIGEFRTLQTRLTNVGSTALSITNITLTGSSEFSQTHTCGTTVGAGMLCSINVTFRPTGSGTFGGVIYINDNGGGSPQTVSLSGSGVAGQCRREGWSCNPLQHNCCVGLRCTNGGIGYICEPY